VTRFVIDAEVLIRIADGSVRVDPNQQLVGPGSLRSQSQEMLYQRVRRGELDRGDALASLERMTEVKVRLLNDRVSRAVAWKLAEQLELSDMRYAEFLAVAQLQADALVTEDAALARLAAGLVRMAAIEELARP
jgi:predicted nucleic acid-binding protein